MNINIRLNKNFQTQFNKMLEKYGEEFLKLQGLNEEKLSFTDFIEAFIDSDNVANASVDSNANIAQKDIVTLMSEMSKPHQKILAFNKLYYELNKKYGFKIANAAMEAMWSYDVYMHDFNTTTFYHYCYKGEEMLTVKYDDAIFDVTFAKLYDMMHEPEVYDDTIKQDAIFPKQLYVRDIDENGNKIWTKISRLVKHANDKPMRFIKYANGLSQIVTEDHPIITSEGEIPAKYASTENQVYSVNPDCYHIQYDSDIYTNEFGWLVGICLAEASARPSVITLKQTETAQYNRILYILNKFHMPYVLEDDDRIRLKVSKLEKIIEEMLIGKTAAFKALPADYNRYPAKFMDGVVAGLIDGDGAIGGYKHRQCQIRIASEELCHQISTYLKQYNVFCGDRTPFIYKSNNSFEQKLPLFGIAFTLTNEDYFMNIGSIKIDNLYEPRVRKTGNFMNKIYQYNYGWINIIENSEYIDTCPIVYDITTETGHFICNHILSHNCFAYDIKDIVERGLFFVDNYNAKPAKHLDSFVQILMEAVAFLARRQSGAVGLPNLIPYLYYFWSRDVKEGYYTESPERYKHQQIQALIYRLNQPWVRTDQAAFTNVSVFDHPYFEAIFGGATFPDGSFMIDEEEEIIQFQKDFIDVVNEIREENIFTFPVLSASLLYKDEKFVDEDFAKWACEASRKWNLFNFFTDSSVNSLSNCCRLKSDVSDLYFNSIGGSALKVGSVKVSTLNIARLAYKSSSEKEFLVNLRDLTELNLKILDVQRDIIKRNVEKGLLPSFTSGLVDFQHLYSTVGINGIYEAMKTFGYTYQDEFGYTYYKDEAYDLGKRIFEVIRNVMNNFMLDKDYRLNLEQVPKKCGDIAA